MEPEAVQIVPPIIVVGKVQTIVVIFPSEIPQDKLITLELSYSQPPRRGGWNSWIPAQPLGANSVLAQLPEVPHAGELSVLVKVSRQTYSPCPMFQLEALSPLQTVLQGASTIQKGSSMSSSTTSVACLVTYLLHTHEKDQSALSHDDKVVCGVLQSQPSFGSNWNLPSLIFGKYGPKESLLHLFVRCKLEGAAGLLLQSTKGKEALLQQKDYKGRTPADIARKKGNKKIAEMVDAAIANSPLSYNHKGLSRSLEQDQFHRLTSSDEDFGASLKQSTGPKQMDKNMRKWATDKKQSHSSSSRPHPPTTCDVDLQQSSDESLQKLLSRKLYSASVLVDYYWENSPFGDVSLKKGDIVHVMKELANDMCQGVCNNFYCTIPKHILSTTNEDCELMTDEELSDDYEEVLDPIDIPDPSGNHFRLPQPHPSPVVERRIERPPLRVPIKLPVKQPSPVPAVPGKLLPSHCKLSNSHESGLNRLGMPPQHVSRDESQGLQQLSPNMHLFKQDLETSVYQEERTSVSKPPGPPAILQKHITPMPREYRGLAYQEHTGPIPQEHRGPIPQEHRGPIPQEHRGPIPQEYRGPIPQEHRGPIPQEHRGPIPQEYRGPIPQEYRGPIPQEHRGPIPQEHRGPIPQEHRGPIPQEYRGPIPQEHRGPIPQEHRGPIPQVPNVQEHRAPIPQEHSVPPAPQEHKVPIPQEWRVPIPQEHRVPIPQDHSVPPAQEDRGPLPQEHRVPIPQEPRGLPAEEDEEDEYDDAITFQESVSQRKEQLTESLKCPRKPPINPRPSTPINNNPHMAAGKPTVAKPRPQPIAPPRHKMLTPPREDYDEELEEEEEEYDDASSIQQRIVTNMTDELQQPREHPVKPTVKLHVSRAASCVGQSRVTPPKVKPRKTHSMENQRNQSPPTTRKPLPVPNAKGSSKIAELQRQCFGNK